jgi:hypothetical protein
MIRNFLAFVLCLAAGSAIAASPEEWRYLYVIRGSYLNYSTGSEVLLRDQNLIKGRFTSHVGADVPISVDINGASATAMLFEGSNNRIEMTGTFRQEIAPGGAECWQTIQVLDGLNFLTLVRSVPAAEMPSCEL